MAADRKAEIFLELFNNWILHYKSKTTQIASSNKMGINTEFQLTFQKPAFRLDGVGDGETRKWLKVIGECQMMNN